MYEEIFFYYEFRFFNFSANQSEIIARISFNTLISWYFWIWIFRKEVHRWIFVVVRVDYLAKDFLSLFDLWFFYFVGESAKCRAKSCPPSEFLMLTYNPIFDLTENSALKEKSRHSGIVLMNNWSFQLKLKKLAGHCYGIFNLCNIICSTLWVKYYGSVILV